jgi:hypothetical protein
MKTFRITKKDGSKVIQKHYSKGKVIEKYTITSNKENAFYNGNQLMSDTYKGEFTRNEVEKLVNKYQRQNTSKDISIAVKIPNLGWRTTGQAIDSDIGIHLQQESSISGWVFSDTKEFKIYYWDKPIIIKKGGHNTPNNDCLFQCILKCLHLENIPFEIRGKEKFKAYFKLERKEMVPATNEIFKTLETLCKTNINVCGDFLYTSENKYHRHMDIGKSTLFIDKRKKDKYYKKHYPL